MSPKNLFDFLDKAKRKIKSLGFSKTTLFENLCLFGTNSPSKRQRREGGELTTKAPDQTSQYQKLDP